MVSFTLLPLYPRRRAAGTLWIGSWVDPRAGLDEMEMWTFLTPPGLELRPLCRPACKQSLYRPSYRGCIISTHYTHNICPLIVERRLWIWKENLIVAKFRNSQVSLPDPIFPTIRWKIHYYSDHKNTINRHHSSSYCNVNESHMNYNTVF
jgi:hypothetical protein